MLTPNQAITFYKKRAKVDPDHFSLKKNNNNFKNKIKKKMMRDLRVHYKERRALAKKQKNPVPTFKKFIVS